MKKIKLETMKLSLSADMKIRMRLYIAQIKKDIQSLKLIKLAVPALMLGILAFGTMQIIGVNDAPQKKVFTSNSSILGELREVKAKTYKAKTLARVNIGKAQSYKTRAHIRSVRARKR